MLFSTHFPVTSDLIHVKNGSTFVAIKGFAHNGADFIDQAVQQGATHIVIDAATPPPTLPAHVQLTIVDDTRKALAQLAAQKNNNPAQALTIIGITGTAGKTTTTFLIEHLIRYAGITTALLGSIKNKIATYEEESTLTSPPADYLHMFFAECLKKEVSTVVMEVSSHALALHRVYGIPFAAAGFTNLSPEHMDFHPTLEDYYKTKKMLFSMLVPHGLSVTNIDNPWGKKLAQELKTTDPHLTLHPLTNNPSNPNAFACIQNDTKGITLTLAQAPSYTFYCPTLFGSYNAYNISMALFIAHHTCKIPWNTLKQALASFPGVPGRLQMHALKNGATAVIDFAHKPDALQSVLSTLRPLTNDLIVVFGCGGNRDTSKRPVMGNIAATIADAVIITDDNPRNEDRMSIAQAIYAEIPKELCAKASIELDRATAIQKAIAQSTPTSIVAVVGKGNETYYLINGIKHHFSDQEEILKYT